MSRFEDPRLYTRDYRDRGSRNTWSCVNWFLLAGVIGVFALNAHSLVSTPTSSNTPEYPNQQAETVDDTLTFSQQDINYLNRIYGEYPNETAYCGIIDPETQVIDIEIAHMTQSHFDSVTSQREECSSPYGEPQGSHRQVDIHTHPPGSDRFSQADKEVLLHDHSQYSCIQYHPIYESQGSDVNGINCKTNEGVESIDEGFPEVNVEVAP